MNKHDDGEDITEREHHIEQALADSQREERAEQHAAIQRQLAADERVVRALSDE